MSLTPWGWLTTLLQCAAEELDTHLPPLAKAPPRQYVTTEGVVWDDCCEHGGQLWTRIVTAFPTRSMPDVDRSFTTCSHSMAVEIGVGIIRCGHTLDDQGRPPTTDPITGDARQITADMVSLRKAIVCCPTEKRKVLGIWTPASSGERQNMGGCVGGEWRVTVPAKFTTEED